MKTFLLSLVFLLSTANTFSAVKTWDGGGADNNWQTPANWVNDVAPVAGDDLVFPANAAQFTANNNFFIFTSFRSITIEGGNYTIGGNPLRLTNGLTVQTGTQMINTAIDLAAAQTFSAGQGSITTIAVLSVGNFPLVLDGNGSFGIGLISGSGSLTKNGLGAALLFSSLGFNGAINVNNGAFVVDADIPGSAVTVNAPLSIEPQSLSFGGIGGTGRIGTTNILSGAISAGSLTAPVGVLTVQGNLNVTSNGFVVIKVGSRTSNTEADRIQVNGTVTLSNPTLFPLLARGQRPPIGQAFEIISNDGTDPIVGTFSNLPEGATFNGALGLSFRITYRGGDGNDVVITSINRANFDFDGDGKSDIAVYRPSEGIWYKILSRSGNFEAQRFGAAEDKITPADFDGDNKTDIAVFRPSDGTWYQLRSSDNTFYAVKFGAGGDIPVPNDYDGDGRADIAVFRPSDGVWYQLRSAGNRFVTQQFGISTDKPLVGDFNGDGIGDLAVYRDGVWYLLESPNGSFRTLQFGNSSDTPTPADYDGDGKTDISVFRPSDGVWYQLNSGSNNAFSAVQFGMVGDRPVPADYDGDGKADVAVFRPSEGVWYLLRSTSGFTSFKFGQNGDKPVPAAFIP